VLERRQCWSSSPSVQQARPMPPLQSLQRGCTTWLCGRRSRGASAAAGPCASSARQQAGNDSIWSLHRRTVDLAVGAVRRSTAPPGRLPPTVGANPAGRSLRSATAQIDGDGVGTGGKQVPRATPDHVARGTSERVSTRTERAAGCCPISASGSSPVGVRYRRFRATVRASQLGCAPRVLCVRPQSRRGRRVGSGSARCTAAPRTEPREATPRRASGRALLPVGFRG
jgi:hypothetical protein